LSLPEKLSPLFHCLTFSIKGIDKVWLA